MLEQEEGSHLSHTACCKTTLQCGTVDISEQPLDLELVPVERAAKCSPCPCHEGR